MILLCLLTAGCRNNGKSADSEWDLSKFRNGDIIYRHGNGFFSDYFRKTSNREQLYSHAGIICVDSNQVFVIHSEASEFTGIGGVKKEALSVFLKDITTWGVYRLDTTQVVRDTVVYHATHYLNKETPFDFDFNNHSDDKIYCTELVAIAVNNTLHRNSIQATGNFRNKRYYAVDDTYFIKEMTPVVRK